jgi:excisionase family DNA binding protein
MNPEEVEPEEEATDLDELLTVGQVAIIFQVTNYTVRVWLKEGKLNGIKVAGASRGHWRISRREVLRLATETYGSGK